MPLSYAVLCAASRCTLLPLRSAVVVNSFLQPQVALKRMGDVLHSPEQAKRVLREICILRRLSHPNVIGLRNCFIAPAATGQCRLVGGKLVHVSIDVYIAMEYAGVRCGKKNGSIGESRG